MSQPARLMRARLNERLTRAAQYPIALIVAPAGFGKSVALRDFLRTSRSEAVLLEVRREDGTLLSFLRRFSAAIAPMLPSAAASFAGLQERLFSSSEPHRIAADWFAEHSRRTIGAIAIDDLHFAAADPESIAFLSEAIDRTADRIRWILATRSDAGLPVASWLAYGRMDLPVDQDDLRFTIDEALASAQAEHSGAAPSDVEALCELTEGWPVALAIALRTHTRPAALRNAATRELIYGYLAEQVFGGIAESQRAFLIASSVFSTFDATIAQALGATPEFLDELRRGVAFLTEPSPGQYRYHDLFRDYLESELLRSGDAAWRNANETGARLLEERGNVAAALALYTKAQDAQAILRSIESDGFGLLERGQADALAAALGVLPDELRRVSPVALGLQATLEAARGHFDAAHRGFDAAIERADRQELRLSLVHRYSIELVRHGRDCVDLLEKHSSEESAPAALRVPLLGTLATAYEHAGRSADALRTIDLAVELLDPSAGDDARARLYQQAAHVYEREGDPERAKRYAKLAVELALARNLHDVAVRAYSVLYTIAYDTTDDPIACLGLLDKLLECARKGASVQGRLYGLMASYGIEADRGDETALDRIERQLADIPGTLAQNRNEVLVPSLALRTAWRGDFKRAYEMLLDAGEPQHDERAAEQFSELALYACAGGLREEAEAANAKAVAALARWNQPTRRALRAELALAFYELARGHGTAAYRHITHVRRELVPSSMSRLMTLCDTATILYRLAIGQGDRAELAGSLERLRAEDFGGMARLLEAVRFPQTEEGGFSALSATEREILEQLVAGGSSRDLAERTSRSPRTIDAHIRSICKKLNCRSRRAAVALAIGAGWV